MYHKQHPNKDGYNKICPRCEGRWGDAVYGVRWLDINPCPKCLDKYLKREVNTERNTRTQMLSEVYRRGKLSGQEGRNHVANYRPTNNRCDP